MKRSKKTDWRGLLLLTQLGISVMIPPVMCLMLANWLVGKYSLGTWVYLVAIFFGIGAAFSSAADLLRPLCRPRRSESDGEDKK